MLFEKFEIITTIENSKHKYIYEDDYSEIISEWISNGSNGTREDILEYCKPTTITLQQIVDGDQSSIAFGIWETLCQSPECDNLMWTRGEDFSSIKITISHGKIQAGKLS